MQSIHLRTFNSLHRQRTIVYPEDNENHALQQLYQQSDFQTPLEIKYLKDQSLDLEAVDFVLRYRNRIKTIQRRLDEMERRMRQKEQEHLNEILVLRRRLAQLSERD